MNTTLLVVLVLTACAFIARFVHARLRNRKVASPNNEPGLGWTERYFGGSELAETTFIRKAMQQIQQVARLNKDASHSPDFKRAFHAKIDVGVENAEFRVSDDIPEALRIGYLQPGKSWPTTIRFSNASGKCQADTEKDLRGAALRVFGDDGEHDLLMTSAAASHARDARQFVVFALAMAGSKALLLPRLIFGLGPFEAFRMLKTVIRQAKKPVTSLSTEGYWSRAPYKFGDRAAKFLLIPHEGGSSQAPLGADFLAADFAERLRRGSVVFDFCVQLFVNEQLTPIEDGVVEWKETDAPPVKIGELVIPQQDLTAEAAPEAKVRVNGLQFNPWNTTANFRPLGSLNRARKLVYEASASLRAGKCPAGGGSMSNSNGGNAGQPQDKPASKCPFHRDIPATPMSGNVGQPGPEFHPENGEWRPKSDRAGIGAAKYVWWNWFYAVMQFFNRAFARNPYNKISWDKWPVPLGLLYLMAKLRFNRSNALTDPYDYKSSDNICPAMGPKNPGDFIDPQGMGVSDDKNLQMGAAMTRFSSNIPPRKVRPDIAQITPTARKVSKSVRIRKLDEDGNPIEIPALILNGAAQAWIQFQFHGFGGNTLRDPINQNPWVVKRDPKENWPGDVALIDRTTQDPTRVGYDGRPTPIDEKVHAWVQGQLYGNNQEEQDRLRTFEGGHLAFDENGLLLEDPSRPGVDLTGMNNNYNPHLSFLHWLFSREHNAIADYLASFHPDWDDDRLFHEARKSNCAQIARIHTVEWTEDLLQHPTLQLGMHADYYGFLGQRLKMYLMRLSARHPFISKLLTPLRHNDFIWGMPGSKWEHHDGPFQVPKHFRLVYRLHELILDNNDIVHPETGELLDRVDLIDFIHHNTRAQVQKFGYDTLAWSFLSKSCGALTLHNFPKSLTQFHRLQDNNLIDLAEMDVFREREDGTGSYNDLRVSLGDQPVTSFMELTGGDAGLAKELEVLYEGDVNKVDAGIGILAEPKPAGFALGYVQFYQFVLNAPRRVKSNRFLSEGYNYNEYQEGMNWVEHGGGFKGAIRRHLPALRAHLEGVKRGFAPWQDTETFPARLLLETQNHTGRAFFADMRTLVIAAAAGVASVYAGLVSVWVVAALAGLLFAGSAAAAVIRMLARRFLQVCEKKCNTDKRGFMFGTLYRCEGRIRRAALIGTVGSLAIMAVSAACFFGLVSSHPWIAVLFALAGLSSTSTYRWSKSFTSSISVLKIALRNRMRNGQSVTDATVHGAPVDEAEVARLFRTYAPGREYMTEWDFARLHEGERVSKRSGSVSCPFSYVKQYFDQRASSRMVRTYADMIVEEDRHLVPAISHEMYIRVLQGVAKMDLRNEMVNGDRDPSPVR